MSSIAYRREIDGLRAIAVLGVVFFHATSYPKAGFVGVDIFFVISGYLITALLLREHAETGAIDLFAFYARRVRRIFPAATLVVLCVLGIAASLLPPTAIEKTANSAAAAVLFVANFFFLATTGGYFDRPAGEIPLLHLWSLSVEEQFYLLWPALLILLLRWRRRMPLVPIMIGLAVASFAGAEVLVMTHPEAAFYLMPPRFWELAVGGLIAALPLRRAPGWLAPVAIVVTVAACLVPLARFPATGALPAVAGAAMLICAIHNGAVSRVLGARLLVGIGLISYSLYLWHWPLLVIYRLTTIGPGSVKTRLVLCGVSLLLAIASYRYVEQPFRRLKTPKKRLVAMGAAISLAIAAAACLYSYTVRTDPASDSTRNTLALQAERDMPSDWHRCHYQVWSEGPLRKGCGEPARVVMWGDSMALSWKPLLRAFGASTIDYSRDACGPFLGWLPESPMPGDSKCRDWNLLVAEQAKNADTVIIAARWSGEKPEAMLAFRNTLQALAGVPRIIVIGQTPELPDEVPRCIRLNAIAKCAISRAEFDRYAAPVRASLRDAAKGLPNVQMLEPADWLCTATECPAIKNGVPLYWDSHHLSSTAASRYASQLDPVTLAALKAE